jgi:tryptophan synthase alpha chain
MAVGEYLKQKLQERELLLMTHAVVGYPSLDDNWSMLECMAEAGVDLVELQLPFSEPIADGPLFIKANQTALDQGLHRDDYFRFMEKASAAFDFPLLFMGYYNSVFCMGHEAFCERLKSAGGEGYIIADLPTEEAVDLDKYAKQHALDPIHMVTPLNSEARLREIAQTASGFIYCVARRGVTGKETRLGDELIAYMQRCRQIINLPLALGFGIRDADHVRLLRGIADIAIVGTACLEAWESGGGEGYLEFLQGLHAATL